jgi:hypothetical protein
MGEISHVTVFDPVMRERPRVSMRMCDRFLLSTCQNPCHRERNFRLDARVTPNSRMTWTGHENISQNFEISSFAKIIKVIT